ncbi:hypothetical protein [Paenibacillus ginsengarvi]|uniref:Uncharacterized protein n=1 Tax=Paenibacillus ginsengarvi TaxID=400777 RepID=A0A3B0CID2_9BACL|nr:hypothetical protein [Paenibacillus ginsengarvi]RKN84468.1 hypothetical protein D7M11_13385 [Paenibacillus ginsengarvi]
MRPLTTNVHLFTAAIDKRLVLVFEEGVLIGSGVIEEITEEAIKIRNIPYPRDTCRFALVPSSAAY